MESELTPQMEPLIEKINALPDGKNLYTGTVMYEGHGRTRLDTEPARITTNDLKALAARDMGEDCAKCAELRRNGLKTFNRASKAEADLYEVQSQLTTALERVREYENFVARMEYAQFEGDYLIDVKDGEGFVLIANPDEDHRTTIGAYDTALEAFQAMVDGRE